MDDGELQRITEEITILKKLHNPNIINFVSGWFDEEKKECVIITEIFPGGSLKKHLNKIKQPRLKLVKFWIREILKGLKYLHSEIDPPIVHRDIKCDNIFIDPSQRSVKIGDLGFSCILKSTYAKSFAGTKEFMAPEVIQGKYTVLADIYSLGLCILEMVTNEKPYKECENIMIIYEQVK
jgi:WNK lysine deficient protein kinase